MAIDEHVAPGTGAELGSTMNEPANANALPVEHEKEANADHNLPSSSQGSSTTAEVVPQADVSPKAPAPFNPEASRTKLQTAVIMASLMSSVFLAALDITIVTTALPTISEHFHSDAGYTWIGSAYLLAQAASTPSWGKFSDIWGRKPILLVAAVVFFVGSLISATSVNIGMLITARGIQGLGGGGLIIMANICIGDLFSIANRGLYYGMIGMTWAFASAVGPLVGGAFTEKVTWRWCFYINLPITGSVIVALSLFLHLDNPKTPLGAGLRAVDWFGSLAIVGGTVMFLLGLEFGGITFPWDSAKVICLIVFGLLVSIMFVIIEWKFAKYPVMPLRLFSNSSNIACYIICFVHGFVFIAGAYYLPLYFQAVLSATPILSGVYNLPFVMALSLSSASTGVFIKKTGKFIGPIYFGTVMMTIGFGLFINLPPTRQWAKIVIYQLIAGVGVGPLFQAPLIALQTRVAPKDIATATASFGFIRNLATSISVVIGAVVFQNQLVKKASTLRSELGNQVASELSGGSAGANVAIISALPAAQRKVAQVAFNSSLKDMWIMYMAVSAVCLFAILGVGNSILSKDHTVIKTGLAAEEANRLEREEEKKKQANILVGGEKSEAPTEEV